MRAMGLSLALIWCPRDRGRHGGNHLVVVGAQILEDLGRDDAADQISGARLRAGVVSLLEPANEVHVRSDRQCPVVEGNQQRGPLRIGAVHNGHVVDHPVRLAAQARQEGREAPFRLHEVAPFDSAAGGEYGGIGGLHRIKAHFQREPEQTALQSVVGGGGCRNQVHVTRQVAQRRLEAFGKFLPRNARRSINAPDQRALCGDNLVDLPDFYAGVVRRIARAITGGRILAALGANFLPGGSGTGPLRARGRGGSDESEHEPILAKNPGPRTANPSLWLGGIGPEKAIERLLFDCLRAAPCDIGWPDA